MQSYHTLTLPHTCCLPKRGEHYQLKKNKFRKRVAGSKFPGPSNALSFNHTQNDQNLHNVRDSGTLLVGTNEFSYRSAMITE